MGNTFFHQFVEIFNKYYIFARKDSIMGILADLLEAKAGNEVWTNIIWLKMRNRKKFYVTRGLKNVSHSTRTGRSVESVYA